MTLAPITLNNSIIFISDEHKTKVFNRTSDDWQRAVSQARGGKTIGTMIAAAPSDVHSDTWEMHPKGEEVLFVLEGSITIVIDDDGVEKPLYLQKGEAGIIPEGKWHRFEWHETVEFLFMTPATDTKMKTA